MITSTSNEKIKNILKLADKKNRELTKTFLIEGTREFELAINNDVEIKSIFFCEKLLNSKIKKNIAVLKCEKQEVSEKAYAKIAYRKNTGGIIAVAKQKKATLTQLKISPNALILVLENIEKPGNIGAILRTADAAGVSAVIVCEPLTDIYNPNVIRSSLGAVFSVPTIETTNKEAFTWLGKNNFSIITTTPGATKNHFEIDMTKKTALVIGSEKDGVSNFWLDNATEKALIPMTGNVNSLNASASAAIVIYEAVRQKIKD